MKKNGIHTEFHENGQKKSEGSYKGVDRWNDPQKIGKWTEWYENGCHWVNPMKRLWVNLPYDHILYKPHFNGVLCFTE